MLWGGSVRLVKGQMLSLNHQPQTATKAKTLKKPIKTTKLLVAIKPNDPQSLILIPEACSL